MFTRRAALAAVGLAGLAPQLDSRKRRHRMPLGGYPEPDTSQRPTRKTVEWGAIGGESTPAVGSPAAGPVVLLQTGKYPVLLFRARVVATGGGSSGAADYGSWFLAAKPVGSGPVRDSVAALVWRSLEGSAGLITAYDTYEPQRPLFVPEFSVLTFYGTGMAAFTSNGSTQIDYAELGEELA